MKDHEVTDLFFLTINSNALASPEALLLMGLIILLIISSAFISGSEVAFFSLKGMELSQLREQSTSFSIKVLELLEKPRQLLATILISNNLVNISIIILFTILTEIVIGFQENALIAFLLEVVALTFILVLFGEIVPKVYAAHNNIRFSLAMSMPLFILSKGLYPLARTMTKYSSSFERRIESKRKTNLSSRELKEAIEITTNQDTTSQENKILKGLVNFGNINVRQILRPRTDILTAEKNTNFQEIKRLIRKNPFSRIPIYDEHFDNIIGMLYIKDLMPHLEKDETFDWNKLLRDPYFVPESKKIDDLLREFQEMRVHMAIVVDEYGGTSGIVTMEDVIEEIVGEIGDEFDTDEIFHYMIDKNNFVFEGKTPLNDVIRMIDLDDEYFDGTKEDAETIGGLLVELHGQIPDIGETFTIKDLEAKVEAADKKRVRRIRVRLRDDDEEEPSDENQKSD